MKAILIVLLVHISTNLIGQDQLFVDTKGYELYHKQIIEIEKLIIDQKYNDALVAYENVFNNYDFIFLREYQVATQIALHINEKQKAMHYLKTAISAGWNMRSIKKNKYLKKMRGSPEWKSIRKEYRSLSDEYEAKLNQSVRKKVKEMYSHDQWKAFGALFTFSSRRQDKYAENKFAPHSENQIESLIKILNEYGYPGERLIGNNSWATTILSHHNSISKEYVQADTLYQFLKPKLVKAIKYGQMSPWELAVIDGWYRAVKSNRKEIGYGYLNSVTEAEARKVNELRQKIGLRSIEARNRLIDFEKLSGINFYLPGQPWVNGKIIVFLNGKP